MRRDTFLEDHWRAERTGVPARIITYCAPVGKRPRITVEVGDTRFHVSVESNPRILYTIGKGKMDPECFSAVRKWIVINQKAILAHWNDEIDSADFGSKALHINGKPMETDRINLISSHG